MKCASLFGLLLAAASACVAADQADVAARIARMAPAHPRLFLKQGAEAELARTLAADPVRARMRDVLLAHADKVLGTKPVERVVVGRRLLATSRECLRRVMHLGLAWRLTGERKYAERARAELLAAAAFTDWNPSHFLDVAEMTAALGIGYDWFFSFLSEQDRATIRSAILTKGLEPSLTHDSWSRAKHNWNQVCNGGLAVGALAIAESEPQLAARIVARAVNTVPLAMHEYAPDGAYPEGASYWSYGTTYNVILISALESALGSDFGLSKQPGFLESADFRLHVFGPTGLPFNYSDSGSDRGLTAAMFWFAAARREPYLLWSEWAKLEALGKPGVRFGGDRADAFLPLWMAAGQQRPSAPPALSWTGHGATPVAFHRTGWDSNAVFVAIKGGSPATNHAHMDVGAFVIDADGTRWADDLGMQDYNSLESKGINLWAKGQDSPRWKVFRLGTSAHNVLMVDGAQQRYESMAPITMSKPDRTVVDLGETYHGLLGAARRGVKLGPDRTVVVQDEMAAPDGRPAQVRWAMVTRTEVNVEGPGRAVLTRDGRRLRLRVIEPSDAALRTWSTDPPAATDAPNTGTRLLGFELTVSAGARQRIVVQFVPESARPVSAGVVPLSEW